IVEAYHVFIKNGFSLFKDKPVSILEIGFGTGLNAFITYLESVKNRQYIDYTGVDAFPVSPEEARLMNYVGQLDVGNELTAFESMHDCPWETRTEIDDYFSLTKRKQDFADIDESETFDLIYFDAFG